MSNNHKKKTILIIIFFIFLKIGIQSKIMVLPFKTAKGIDKSYFWFGKAFSFYLTVKLNSININTFTDSEVNKIISINSIKSPYRFTKASAIKIGQENNATIIIWGDFKISNNYGFEPELIIQPYIIDPISLKQQYLPIIKSKVKNLTLIQHELLNSIIKKLSLSQMINKKSILTLNNQSYELFIKSLLSNNFKEKEYLLKKALELINNDKKTKQSSNLINFKLASLYFDNNSDDLSRKYLKKINSSSITTNYKIFLSALLDSKSEEYQNAINKFETLKKDNMLHDIINNNLGVLYIKTGNFYKAEKYLLNAIKSNKNIIFYNNILNLYLKGSNNNKLKQKAIDILNEFPTNIYSISLLYHFIDKNNNKNALLQVFNEFINNENIIDYFKLEIKLQLINPFSNNSSIDSENSIYIENKKCFTLEDFIQKLEQNPFNYKTHLILSTMYRKIKKFRKAEIYGISSLFLNKTKSTINNLITIYKLLGNRSKIRELNTELKKFE